MPYGAPFGARSTATGCGRSSASNRGGGAAGVAPATSFAAAGVGRERGRGCGGRGDVRLAPTASTWCGEYDGSMPGAKWSPEQHRRRARATAGFGLRRSDGYSVQMERRGGGFGSVAHGVSDEQVGELGDGPERAVRRRRSPAAGGWRRARVVAWGVRRRVRRRRWRRR